MALTIEQARKLKITGILISIGALLGLIYPIFSDGFRSIYPFINGLIIGILIAALIGFFEFIVFGGRFKKRPFAQIFFARVVLYSLAIFCIVMFVFIIYRMLHFDLNFYSVLHSEEFLEFTSSRDFKAVWAYVLGIVALTNFVMQINKKMGQGVLWGFVSGRYYHPREVERVIMFISIQEAKTMIAQMGRLKYHKYLKEILFDVTDHILFRKAVIYEYVDNEMVLLWKRKPGLENANCIRVFFDIKNKIESEKINYFEHYQAIPKIQAASHIGKVIQGEIGDIKSEIRYSGDAMNTAARILGQTSPENEFLVSQRLMELINLPIIYQAEDIGTVSLKGKQRPLNLQNIKEKQVKTY